MTPFTTARDVSLSIWQSAVKAASTEASGAPMAMRDALPRTDAAPRANAAPESQMSAATAVYVATADPHTSAPEDAALQAKGFTAMRAMPNALQEQAELSALHHQLAEAIVSNNTMAQRLITQQIKGHQGIDLFDWMKPVLEYVKYYQLLKGQPQYRSWKIEGNNNPDYSLIEWNLPANGRVALIADWGTGRAEAINVLKAACSLHPNAIIHLGDIYFSGLPDECRANFFDLMRTYAVDAQGAPLPVFNMAGNHDYYSGGAGFLGLIDMLNDGARKQDASYFCLRSADGGWQFLAADTGFNDHSITPGLLLNPTGPELRPDEIEWHHHKLDDPRFTGRTILLTHHQPFSANEEIGANDGSDHDSINQSLLAAFAGHQDRIPLWLCGHEHRLMAYRDFQGVQRVRCIGHGAVPVASHEDPYTKPKYSGIPFDGDVRLGTKGDWYNHGFTFITLHGVGKAMNVDYYQVIEEDTEMGYSMVSLFREEVA